MAPVLLYLSPPKALPNWIGTTLTQACHESGWSFVAVREGKGRDVPFIPDLRVWSTATRDVRGQGDAEWMASYQERIPHRGVGGHIPCLIVCLQQDLVAAEVLRDGPSDLVRFVASSKRDQATINLLKATASDFLRSVVAEPSAVSDGWQDSPVNWESPRELVGGSEAADLLAHAERLAAAADRWLEDLPAGGHPDEATVASDRSILLHATRAPEMDLMIVMRVIARLAQILVGEESAENMRDAFQRIGVPSGRAERARRQFGQVVAAAMEVADGAGASASQGLAEQLESFEESLAPAANDESEAGDEDQDLPDISRPWRPGDPWVKGRIVHMTAGLDAALRDKELTSKLVVRGVGIASAAVLALGAVLKAMFL